MAPESRYQPIKSARSGGAACGASHRDRARKVCGMESRTTTRSILVNLSREKMVQSYAVLVKVSPASSPSFPGLNCASALEELELLNQMSSHDSGTLTARPLPARNDDSASSKVISLQLPLNGTAAFRSKRQCDPGQLYPEGACSPASNRKRGISAATRLTCSARPENNTRNPYPTNPAQSKASKRTEPQTLTHTPPALSGQY